MQSRDLPAAFGQEVLIDLTRPIEPAAQAWLAGLMRAHGLLVFPTTGLTADQQRAATACFGRIMCDPQGLPLENYVSNQRQSSAPDGELIFHYDYAYDRNPTEFISLYGEEIAPGATPTRFASSARALDLVPATLRAAIEKRHALHACFMDRAAPAAARAAAMDDAIPRGQPGWSSADWRIARPLIWQNRAGVPCLYACLQHTIRVLDMDIADSDALLAQLFDTLYRADNVYEHQWRPGDLVIWDNRTIQHARPTPAAPTRTLRRFEVCEEDLTNLYLAIGRANGYV